MFAQSTRGWSTPAERVRAIVVRNASSVFDHTAFWCRSGIGHAASLTADEFQVLIAPALGDLTSSLALAAGIAAALLRRERTGVGGVVDACVLSTGMWMLSPAIVASKLYGIDSLPRQRHREAGMPLIAAYRTADQREAYIAAVRTDLDFRNLCECLGREQLADDERFSTTARATTNNIALVAGIDQIFGHTPSCIGSSGSRCCAPLGRSRRPLVRCTTINKSLPTATSRPRSRRAARRSIWLRRRCNSTIAHRRCARPPNMAPTPRSSCSSSAIAGTTSRRCATRRVNAARKTVSRPGPTRHRSQNGTMESTAGANSPQARDPSAILTPDQRVAGVRVVDDGGAGDRAQRCAPRRRTAAPVPGAVRARRPRPSAPQPVPLVPRAEPRVRRHLLGALRVGRARRWTCRASRTSTCWPGRSRSSMYVKRPAPGREARLDELLDRIRSDDDVSYKAFADAAELEALVADDLSLLAQRGVPRRDPAPTPPADPRFTLPGDATHVRRARRRARRARRAARAATTSGWSRSPAPAGSARRGWRCGSPPRPPSVRRGRGVRLAGVAHRRPARGRRDRHGGRAARQQRRHASTTLTADLGDRSLLLVVDNFEHVIGRGATSSPSC